MSKILITGANSFVGKNFSENSQFKDVDEICLIKNKIEDIDFSNYDTIIHVAAIVHQTSKISESVYFHVNRDLCIDVAKQAKSQGVRQFIFLSTVKVYGDFNPQKGIWTEKSECYPKDSYGKSKYQAEVALEKLRDKNFVITIIRPPLIYGIGVKANMLNLIKLVDKFSVLPLGGINNRRSYTSIENLVHLIDLTIKKRVSGTFLAMDEKPLSTTELCKIIANCFNKKIRLFNLPKPTISIGKILIPRIFDRLYGSFEIDNSLTRKTLNYKPQQSTEVGIDKMVKAYLDETKR